jgi:hypothetical protein
LIGLLLAAEFVVRVWRFDRIDGSIVGSVIRRIHAKARRDG